MSEKEKKAETTTSEESKVVTRYERRLEKRKKQEEKERHEKTLMNILGGVILALIVALILSFPIRNYLAIHKTFITVGGEKITRVEFDYQYNLAKNNYVGQYGAYLSYFGLDLSKDLSTQMYTDTLTWEDFFQEMAVDGIKRSQALLAAAKEAGFTYDTTEEYKENVASLKEMAANAGLTYKDYLKQTFGLYASEGRLESYIKEGLVASAYYKQVSEDKAPSGEEISSYYEENKDNYDLVDYRLTTVEAVLPTAPTTATDETEAIEAEVAEEAGTETTEEEATTEEATTEEAYVPTEEEVAAAMKEARKTAEADLATITESGESFVGGSKATIHTAVAEWLYDAERKAGDTEIIEDTDANSYYVVAFEKRYRDDTATQDVRMIATATGDVNAILTQWQSGPATQESFGRLAKEVSEDTYSKANGGLYEGVTKGSLPDAVEEWIFAADRKEGDVTAIPGTDGGTGYVVYYVGANAPAWELEIKSTLLSQTMSAYLEELIAPITVEDPKGNLRYLTLAGQEEAQETAAEETQAAEGDTQATAASETAETTASEGAAQ